MIWYKVYFSDVFILVMGIVGKVVVVFESVVLGIINLRLVCYKFDFIKIYFEFIKVFIFSKCY